MLREHRWHHLRGWYFQNVFFTRISIQYWRATKIYAFLKCQFQCFENFYNITSRNVIHFSKVSFIREENVMKKQILIIIIFTVLILFTYKKKKYKYFWESIFLLSFIQNIPSLYYVIILRFYRINIYIYSHLESFEIEIIRNNCDFNISIQKI